jgi:hypothetical protein
VIATKPWLNPAGIGSILLGRFSAWLGALVAPTYLALFVLAATHPASDRPALAALSLSPVLPTAGLALGVLGLMLGRLAGRAVPPGCVAGVMLHASALALAAALPWVLAGA